MSQPASELTSQPASHLGGSWGRAGKDLGESWGGLGKWGESLENAVEGVGEMQLESPQGPWGSWGVLGLGGGHGFDCLWGPLGASRVIVAWFLKPFDGVSWNK